MAHVVWGFAGRFVASSGGPGWSSIAAPGHGLVATVTCTGGFLGFWAILSLPEEIALWAHGLPLVGEPTEATSKGGGGGSEAPKKVCARKIDLQWKCSTSDA